MTIYGTLALLFLMGAAYGAPAEDLIVDLPGLQFDANYEQYSGYLQVTDERFYHYWFVESQNDPVSDPLVLWLNGGPGCSSLLGFFTENGPFYIDQDGEGVLWENPHSWNKNANMLYLSSPACVGFSYDVNGDCVSSDDSTADTNYVALQQFFEKFPEYQANEFYVTGDSYAGTYVPTLTERIVDGQDEHPMNFQGFAIGNPWFDTTLNLDSKMYYAYYHGLIGETTWNALIGACCQNGNSNRGSCTFYGTSSSECDTLVNEVVDLMFNDGLNVYGLYTHCSTSVGMAQFPLDRERIQKQRNITMNRPEPLDELTNQKDPGCENLSIESDYLNDRVVRETLHIPTSVQEWEYCVSLPYIEQYPYVVDKVAYVAAATRGLIYSGDVDMMCNVIGGEWDIEDLNLPVVEERRTWGYKDQVAGFVKRFENLDFATVKGAGHSVPSYKPGASLQLVENFINQEPY